MGEHESFSNEELFSIVDLPCERKLPNRLVKVAMYEHLAAFGGGKPRQAHHELYKEWSKGDWGMIMTGNVQVQKDHLSLGRDMVIPSPTDASYSESLHSFRLLSEIIRGHNEERSRPLAIMQLNHTGRQSPRIIGGRHLWREPVAPSNLPLGSNSAEGWFAKSVYRLLFQRPRPLEESEVAEVVEMFKNAALFAAEVGFDGVEVHASHGYLLAQFMSPKVNLRTDQYSNGIKIIKDIVLSIRNALPSTFVLGLKLNSADYVSGGLSIQDARDHISQLAHAGIDFIEISGGDYEHPDFMSIASPRQAFFQDFSALAMQAIETLPETCHKPLILLTGGFRSVHQMRKALKQGDCHLIGLGRLSVLCPDLPQRIRSKVDFAAQEPDLAKLKWFPKLLGAGVGTAWYVVQMGRLAEGQPVDWSLGSLGGVVKMWIKKPYQLLILLLGPLVLWLVSKIPSS